MTSRTISDRRRVPLVWWFLGPTLALTAVATVAYRWATQPATWPTELDEPIAASLFSNAEQPTDADLELLNELVADIALTDPAVVALLGESDWPDPQIVPAFWSSEGSEARSVLIGGSFQLELDSVDYRGPWPSTGCDNGRYRGTIRDAEAGGLTAVRVMIDLTFGRATRFTVPPQRLTPQLDGGQQVVGTPKNPKVQYRGSAQQAPWYTGSCPRFTWPD